MNSAKTLFSPRNTKLIVPVLMLPKIYKCRSRCWQSGNRLFWRDRGL